MYLSAYPAHESSLIQYEMGTVRRALRRTPRFLSAVGLPAASILRCTRTLFATGIQFQMTPIEVKELRITLLLLI
jgi:hypothetical protein